MLKTSSLRKDFNWTMKWKGRKIGSYPLAWVRFYEKVHLSTGLIIPRDTKKKVDFLIEKIGVELAIKIAESL